LDDLARVRDLAAERSREADESSRAKINEMAATIDRLTAELQEALDMARKPLTEEQLLTCFVAGGLECPRCQNDDADEMELGDGVDDDADPTLTHQDISCNCCHENWRLRFRLEAVERGAVS
jgi:hypothetical protein